MLLMKSKVYFVIMTKCSSEYS